MAFFVVIRGPLGVGKTSVAGRLAETIGAEHILIDQILDERGLEEWDEDCISLKSFLRANEFAAVMAQGCLAKGTPVIFDGNFYWETQIEDLIDRLDYRHYVFTLRAPLSVCIERDSHRDPSYGAEAAREVYAKSTGFQWGIGIDATRPIDSVVGEILSRLSGSSKPYESAEPRVRESTRSGR
jgi:predicted kinase